MRLFVVIAREPELGWETASGASVGCPVRMAAAMPNRREAEKFARHEPGKTWIVEVDVP